MKGLLLKDFYMTVKYCRLYFFAIIIFAAVSIFNSDDTFFLTYPSMLCASIPISLMGYDEKSRWNEYCGALPYKKNQLVSEKYIFSLIAIASYLLIFGIIFAIKALFFHSLTPSELGEILGLIGISSLVTPSICLPFLYKFGVEKGRFVFIGTVMLFVIAASVLSDVSLTSSSQVSINAILLTVCIVMICVFALSWLLSIKFYTSRK